MRMKGEIMSGVAPFCLARNTAAVWLRSPSLSLTCNSRLLRLRRQVFAIKLSSRGSLFRFWLPAIAGALFPGKCCCSRVSVSSCSRLIAVIVPWCRREIRRASSGRTSVIGGADSRPRWGLLSERQRPVTECTSPRQVDNTRAWCHAKNTKERRTRPCSTAYSVRFYRVQHLGARRELGDTRRVVCKIRLHEKRKIERMYIFPTEYRVLEPKTAPDASTQESNDTLRNARRLL